MSFTRDDVRRKMGWSDGDEYRDICESHHHSMSERVSSYEVRDGAGFMSHVGDEAERAYHELERDEQRREEEKQEEAARERQEERRRAQQREEENYSEY